MISIKSILTGVLLLISGLASLIVYNLTNMDIEHLISCSTDEGGTKIPSNICELYMASFRVTRNDIKELSSGAGIDYILNGENPKKYKIANLFISKGLDVNGVNHFNGRDLTPLHTAVLHNDLQRIKFLIDNEADTEIRSKSYGMTALELANTIYGGDMTEDRKEIIKILMNASGRQEKNRSRAISNQ